ncbi:MAG: dihydrolipoamide acetyltransferase family protein [Nitriliruptoraceae bacterium]
MPDVGVIRDFPLPDLGEGLEEGEIVAWHVEVGDEVELNQSIAEIETAKALVAIPCPFAGTIVELMAEVGTTMEVGSVLVRVRTDERALRNDPADSHARPSRVQGDGLQGDGVQGDSTTVDRATGECATEERATGNRPAAASAAEDRAISDDREAAASDREPPSLVGYGRDNDEQRRRRSTGNGSNAGGSADSTENTGRGTGRTGYGGRVLAKPPVRKLARDLGVDLSSVVATGDGGVITRGDVEAAARPPDANAQVAATSTSLATPRALGIGFRGRRPGEIEPIRAVRKRIVEKMELSRRDIPAASCTVEVDLTRLWSLRHDLTDYARRDGWDVKITVFGALMRATVLGLRRFPTLNARLVGRDPDNGKAGEIHLLEDINLGFAVDTDRGLVVPNIKRADTKSLIELSTELAELSVAARDGRIDPAAVTGGTFTVNNYGVFGNDDGDPIINHPEAGILGIGAIRERPWVVDGQVVPRRVATLRLSFDHRVCDGAEGGRFLSYVGSLCEEPSRILLHG